MIRFTLQDFWLDSDKIYLTTCTWFYLRQSCICKGQSACIYDIEMNARCYPDRYYEVGVTYCGIRVLCQDITIECHVSLMVCSPQVGECRRTAQCYCALYKRYIIFHSLISKVWRKLWKWKCFCIKFLKINWCFLPLINWCNLSCYRNHLYNSLTYERLNG